LEFISVTRVSSLLHHAVEKLACAVQVRLGGVFGNFEGFGDLADAGVEPVVHAQGGLVDLGERFYAIGEETIALGSFETAVGGRVGGGGMVEGSFVFVRAAEADTLFEVDGLVEGDAIDPGAELGLAAEGCDGVVDLEEDLLRHVFGFGDELAAENGDREAKHERAVAVDQLGEGLLVAFPCSLDELSVARFRDYCH
jgi:hypothetical protein